MHIRSENTEFKPKAMYIPPSLKIAQASEDVQESITLDQGSNTINFMRKFRK